MSTLPISLPEHRITLPLQLIGDSPVALDNDADLVARQRLQAQRVIDQGTKFSYDDLSNIVAKLVLST
jgi:hypothetical protein